ncbi:GNAT family N-acetyltransferase [Vibrio chagasii]|uniref:GNAT family N-acetyltransferase n=1 Tax=Vibrio sp. ZF 223 TaxID=2056191 RepID=UPI000D360EBB|nr:GNAT family N-acetyltransferase [Vibrio sp. ZF 223]PTQ04144.1 GNAT family N-acetyltransferase [Vibrio sp. ZF 223]CAH6841009.1 GNAT family N-acetyltransferase [Vibrio chagasii]
MIQVKNVAFDSENEQSIRSIRENVFINEQSIAPEIEFDGLDSSAIHAVVTVDGKPVGTGRILSDGHIGRIAIMRDFRGQGLGSKIVLSLIDEAKKSGYKRVYLGSQKQAIDFYTKLGFTPFGEEFMEAGIVHLSMEKALA